MWLKRRLERWGKIGGRESVQEYRQHEEKRKRRGRKGASRCLNSQPSSLTWKFFTLSLKVSRDPESNKQDKQDKQDKHEQHQHNPGLACACIHFHLRDISNEPMKLVVISKPHFQARLSVSKDSIKPFQSLLLTSLSYSTGRQLYFPILHPTLLYSLGHFLRPCLQFSLYLVCLAFLPACWPTFSYCG